MDLYLVRHGQSYVNLPEWDGGNTDEPLTDLGQRQATAAAAWLPSHLEKVDAIFASTMKRAQETAAPIAAAYNNAPIINDTRLREIGNNKHDHTPWPSDDLPNYGELWGSERPFDSITPKHEGGESMMHFRIRVGQFIEEMVCQFRDKHVIAVCHGGVIDAAVDHIFNIGPYRRCEVWSKNTGITRFQFIDHPDREAWRLHYQNRVEHYTLMNNE